MGTVLGKWKNIQLLFTHKNIMLLIDPEKLTIVEMFTRKITTILRDIKLWNRVTMSQINRNSINRESVIMIQILLGLTQNSISFFTDLECSTSIMSRKTDSLNTKSSFFAFKPIKSRLQYLKNTLN